VPVRRDNLHIGAWVDYKMQTQDQINVRV